MHGRFGEGPGGGVLAMVEWNEHSSVGARSLAVSSAWALFLAIFFASFAATCLASVTSSAVSEVAVGQFSFIIWLLCFDPFNDSSASLHFCFLGGWMGESSVARRIRLSVKQAAN